MAAPLLQTTTPADNSTGVLVSANLVLTYNQTVQAGSGLIQIRRVSDEGLVKSIDIGDTSQITFSGNQVTINPTTDLPAGTAFYVVMSGGAVRNLANEGAASISTATQFNFTTTGSAGDTTAPVRTGTTPADNATGVAVSSNLTLTYNESVKAGSGVIQIRRATDESLVTSIDITDTTQVSFSGSQVTINPTADLPGGTAFYVVMSGGAVRDLANNDAASISSATAFNFTTAAGADTTAPLLTATLPADNATNVAPSANLVLTFNESVKIGSGWIEIRKTSDGSLVKNIAINDTNQVAFAGNQITVNPTNSLDLGTGYYVTVSFGAVLDLANNQFAGITTATAFNFTTTSTPPALPLAKVGPEFPANTATEGSQHGPTVAALTDGRFVVVWSDFSANPEDSNGATRGQIFNAAGGKVGSEFLINTTTTGTQTGPIVTGLSDGRFIVTWTHISNGFLDVNAQLFAANGSKSGGQFPVATTAGQQFEPIATALADGRFVIAWTEQYSLGEDNSSYGVRAQIFDSVGDKIGSDFLVNTTTTGNQQYPAIAALASGGFVVAFTDQASSSARAQIYDEDGAKVGTEIVVASASAQDGPAVVGLANGNFVVLWKVLDSSMYGRVFDADGDAVGMSFLVSNAASSDAGTPRPYVVDTLDDGRFVVTWTHWTGTSSEVHAQVFNPDGTKSGAEIPVNTTVAGSQVWPALDVLADGKVVIAWSDIPQGEEGNVRAQLFAVVQGQTLTGTGAANTLVGGAGDDTIKGLGRADTLTGGGGIDTFVYTAVSESTSTNRDTITDFNASEDLIDLWFQVTGVDTAVISGSLGTRRFDSDLASAVNASKLAAHHAVLFTPNAGTLLGSTFLIVDVNGVAGYQASADLVILLGSGSNLTGLTTADFV